MIQRGLQAVRHDVGPEAGCMHIVNARGTLQHINIIVAHFSSNSHEKRSQMPCPPKVDMVLTALWLSSAVKI